jgi:O-Antigen ligase
VQHISSILRFVYVGFGGFLFGIYPEIGALILVLGAFLDFFMQGNIRSLHLQIRKNTVLVILFSLFCCTRIVLGLRGSHFLQGILECVAAGSMLFFSFWLHRLKQYFKFLSSFIFLGILCMALYVVIPWLMLAFRGGLLSWIINPTLATVTEVNGISTFQPVSVNSYILQETTMQGSGRVVYQIEVRADKPFTTSIGFIQSSLPNGRVDRPCLVTSNWSYCSVEANLSFRDVALLGIGGFGTWGLTGPKIETRNPHVTVLSAPSIIEVLTKRSRQAGFSFNFNALGSHMAIAGLLAVSLAPSALWIVFAICPAIFCMFLSDSRGASAAFVLGFSVLLIIRTRFYKFLPWLTFAFFCIAIILILRGIPSSANVQSETTVHSLNIADKSLASDRFFIWRLATKAWLENPQTFLLGNGDLSAAMTRKLDTTTKKFVLDSEGLTHAHNLWLQTAGESGLLGLSIMLVLWGWVVLKAWRARDSGALALLAAIFVINSVDYLFFYAPVHLCFWIAAAGFKKSFEDSINNLPAKLETL